MATKVEAEGGELVLRSKTGDIAIIPKHMAANVRDLVGRQNHAEISRIINDLPTASSYAQDGTKVPVSRSNDLLEPVIGVDLSQTNRLAEELIRKQMDLDFKKIAGPKAYTTEELLKRIK